MKYYEYGCEISLVVAQDELHDPYSDPDAFMAQTIQNIIGPVGGTVIDTPTLLGEWEA